MKLGDYSIRPFVVVVPELPDKTSFILKHFREVGIEAETFNGIHGVTSGLHTIHNYEVDHPGSKWNIGISPVATWLSFYMLWSAMNLLPDTHFMTLEWDAQFPENWRERTEAALRNVPKDFDLLYLGSCCCDGKPKNHVAGEVFDLRYPMCGQATIVAKKALPVMLATQRKIYAPLDISLAFHTLHLLKCYTILPRIVQQFDKVIPP